MSVKVPVNADAAAPVMKAIRRIVRAIDMRSKKVARETGLTIPQIVVLQAIRELGDVTTAALSKDADISPATTVTILDNLEGRGLVARRRSASDRRIVHTALTRRGADILSKAPPLFDDEFLAQFARMPRAGRAAVIDALRSVADMLDSPRPRRDKAG